MNLITYARGLIKYRFLHGHNAENVKKHLCRLSEKLVKSGVRTPMQWFRFEASLHYLADSYTFAHNRIFTGNLREHRLYERLLHEVFVEYLKKPHSERFTADEACHEMYLSEKRSYLTDCRYIFGTALNLCERLPVKWRSDLSAVREEHDFYGEI